MVAQKLHLDGPPARPSLEQLCEALRAHDATLVDYVATVHGGGGDSDDRDDLVYTAFVVSPKSCAPKRVDLAGYKELNAALTTWRAAVEKTQRCYAKRGDALRCLRPMAEIDRHAAALHERVWAPLNAAIGEEETSRVIVVPDGELGALAFEGLVTPGGKYLIEEHELLFVPYPAALLDPLTGAPLTPDAPRKGRRKKGSALVLGDIDYAREAPDALKALGAWQRCTRKGCDLRMVEAVDAKKLREQVAALHSDALRGGASHCGRGIAWSPLRTEARAVAEMLGTRFGDRVTLVTGDAAHEPLVADAMEGRQIIHVATHGFFIDDSDCKQELSGGGIVEALDRVVAFGGALIDLTRMSGIVLTGASRAPKDAPSDQDGLLDGAELRALDLSEAELVTLSACETGLGVAFAGDGVHALTRALIEAGARRTVTSLWQVPSQPTSDLFVRLYDTMLHPKKPRTAARAMRAAKLDAIERARARGVANNSFLWAGFVLLWTP